MVAHAIIGSTLCRVSPEPRRAQSEAISESVETCASETAFDAQRRAVLELLKFGPDTPTVIAGYAGEHGMVGLVIQLLKLSDEAVLKVLAIVMAEALESGTALIEVLGARLGIDMTQVWQPDDALLDLIKDREVLESILVEVAGENVAQANASATGKVKRRILRDCLRGEGGRAKVDGWVPRWIPFPPAAYTERAGVGIVSRASQVTELITPAEPEAPASAELPQAA